MVTIFYGNRKDKYTKALYNSFAEDCKQGKNALLLVPEQFTVHAETKVFSLTGAIGGNCEVVSFKRLCYRILFCAGKVHRSNLDNAGKAVVMHRALKSLEGELEFYGGVKPAPSFVARLLGVKDELVRCSVKTEQLLNASRSLTGSSGKKLYELGLILSAYEGLLNNLGEGNQTDMELADDALDETDAFCGYNIYIDGFFSFSKQEYELLARLVKRCNIYISLMCDTLVDTQGGYGLFSDIQATAQNLIAIAQKSGAEVSTQLINENTYHKKEDLRFLNDNLFINNAVYNGKSESIVLYRASDMYKEAIYTACRIKELCRQGYRYGDFAILVRNEADYKGIIDSVFRMYNIPVFTDKKTELMQKPLILSVITAMQIAIGKYTTDDIFTYLKTGLSCLNEQEIAMLQKYCTVWDIAPSRWFEGEFKNNPDGFTDKEKNTELLSNINTAKEKLISPIAQLKSELKGTAADMCTALYGFTENTKVGQRLRDQANELESSGEYTLAQEARQSYEIFIKALEQLATAAGNTDISKEEFCNLLSCCLSTYDIGRIPTSLDEVIIGSPDRLKCNDKKCVFVLGLNEGIFPANITDTGIINDTDRKKLLLANLPLEKCCDDLVLRERFYAYFAFTLASERLYLTCSENNLQKQELATSCFMEQVAEMFSLNILHRDNAPMQDVKMLMEGLISGELVSKELENYFSTDKEYSALYEQICALRNFGKNDIAVSRKLNSKLQNEGLSSSPSRIETYFQCRFAHFCNYVLGIKEVRKANIDSPEVGTFIHHALETVLKNAIQSGVDIWKLPKEELEEQLLQIVENYLEGYLGGAEDKSGRFIVLFNRLKLVLTCLIERLCNEFKDCMFKTVDFELEIGNNGAVPAMDIKFDGGTIRVSGYVDRVDLMENEDGKYIRIVDYKTGAKEFKMRDIYNGINLQMLLYLFTICKNGQSRYGEGLHPAGILYYPANETFLLLPRNMSKEEKQSNKQKKYRQNGLLIRNVKVLEGMEQLLKGKFIPASLKADGNLTSNSSVTTEKGFAAIEKHIEGLLSQIGKEMISGNVTPNPFKCNYHNSCTYCKYGAICGYEPIRGGREYENYEDSELKITVEEQEDE